jgi:hypothetical protein
MRDEISFLNKYERVEYHFLTKMKGRVSFFKIVRELIVICYEGAGSHFSK